ncbi:hypothetical protein BVY01_02155 [bacterium I07]|nr:hypothetical protein BVY01_02155 [bacterium I07]
MRQQLYDAIAERFVGSVRREALDYYLFFSEKQILHVLQEYFDYFNTKRPHQGIALQIPMGFTPQPWGRVYKTNILFGLCHHYYRMAA